MEIPSDGPPPSLDENGFPVASSDDDGSDGGDRGDCLPIAGSKSEFALEFYRSGTDWSCLVQEEQRETRGLVQRDLFQMWGIQKPAEQSKARAPSPPRKKRRRMMRMERKATGSGPHRPRACPFYKKIIVYICPLELGMEHIIDGVKVTMLEANHCPGAALIYFCLTDGRCLLHTGDFRASKQMQSYPLLVDRQINVLYLDTTYCNPKYRFPPKEYVVDFVVRITLKYLEKQPKTLIVVGAYSIGKEQVYVAISQALGVQIYTDSSRRRILQTFDWPELSEKICSCGKDTPVHVLPLSFLQPENLKEYLKTYAHQFTAVLAFRPTGWTYSETTGKQLDLIRPTSKGNITIYGVPYSEHSSFTELKEFIKFLKPEKIIPTVNVGNAATRDKMHSYFREWLKA